MHATKLGSNRIRAIVVSAGLLGVAWFLMPNTAPRAHAATGDGAVKPSAATGDAAATPNAALRRDGRMALTDLPEAARKALTDLAAGAEIRHVEQETSNGVIVYEADWSSNGGAFEASVMADGTLLELEERVAMAAAPEAVRAAIAARFGADAKVAVEKKTVILYEAEGRKDGKEIEILITPTGRVMGGDDDDDDDDNDDAENDND